MSRSRVYATSAHIANHNGELVIPGSWAARLPAGHRAVNRAQASQRRMPGAGAVLMSRARHRGAGAAGAGLRPAT